MNVKVRVLLSIFILTILGGIFIARDMMNELKHDPVYTVQTSAVYTDDFGIFFMENWNDMGRIYRIGTSGEVLAMTGSGNAKMDSAEELVYNNGRLYALFSSEKADKDGTYLIYRIAAYDENLDMVSFSEAFTIDKKYSVCSLTADGIDIFITALSENGASVSVFAVPIRSLWGIEHFDDETSSDEKEVTRADYNIPESVLYRDRTKERFYVDACYVGSELHVLLDGDGPEGFFAPDARIKKAVDSISFSFGQRFRLHLNLIIRIIGIFLIWLILVIITLKLTKDRDRIVYLFSASVFVFFIILFIAFIFIRDQFHKNEMNNNTKFAMMVMQEDMKYYSGVDYEADDYYDSTKYYRLLESLSDVLNENANTEIFRDVFIMRKSTGIILTDARGHNGIHASFMYGRELSDLIDELNAGESPASVSFILEDEELTAVAYEGEDPKDDVALVAVCKDRSSSESYKSSVRGLRILFLIIFVAGSIMLFVTLYMQHLDLKKFSAALKDLALEDVKVEAPKILSRDMRGLWQSYGELSKKIEEINYEKYRVFEAYYRFAPKGIEKIMSRDSIFDVVNGDVATVNGAMVILSIDREEVFEKKVRGLSDILTNLEKYATQNEAFLVSRDQTLSNVRFLVTKENGNMVSHLTQFIHAGTHLNRNEWAVLIYKDMLTYGVAGSQSQSLTYIDSEYTRVMGNYAEWFRRQGVPLVVTERIIRSEDVGETRYVGCAGFAGSRDEVNFYEVLDAYPAGIRQAMLINRTKFEDTLELYYSKNFYLARNQFMEILKDCPQDGITKWYIFECERYINGEADITQSGYIHADHTD